MSSTVRPNGRSGTDLSYTATLLCRSLSTTSRTSTSWRFRWFRRVYLCSGHRSSSQRRYVYFSPITIKTDHEAAERLPMRMSELVESVSKKPIPPWTKNLLVEVMVNDEDDEDVEVRLLCSRSINIANNFRSRTSWSTSRFRTEGRGREERRIDIVVSCSLVLVPHGGCRSCRSKWYSYNTALWFYYVLVSIPYLLHASTAVTSPSSFFSFSCSHSSDSHTD
jgi:hypothetical protein